MEPSARAGTLGRELNNGPPSGKVALIAGGNVGIGEAIAKTFAREGAAVVITGRRKAELDRVAQGDWRAHGRCVTVAGSVTDETHAEMAVQQAIVQFGALDILVNNAGVARRLGSPHP